MKYGPWFQSGCVAKVEQKSKIKRKTEEGSKEHLPSVEALRSKLMHPCMFFDTPR